MQRLRFCLTCFVVLLLASVALGPVWAQEPPQPDIERGERLGPDAQPELSVASMTFVVNSTADPGDGICDSTECTLREAINAANDNPGADTIAFNIPGVGPHTIQPLTDLPDITDGVTIDGYTQPGAVVNTNPIDQGLNSVLMIELNGDLTSSPSHGLDVRQVSLSGDSVTIRGLAINGFDVGVLLYYCWTDVVIQGNSIGLDATGETAKGNDIGVFATEWVDVFYIGGPDPQDANVISGNGIGIRPDSCHYAVTVEGNLIGPSASGASGVGNQRGLYITEVCNILVGNNIVAYNTGANAIEVERAWSIVTIAANSIHDNEGLGIDLYDIAGSDAITANDMPDVDGIQNYPELGPVVLNAATSEIVVHGTLYSAPDSTFTIEFYANAECDPSGYGEGEVYLGSLDVHTDALGEATFETTFDDPGLPVITATATSSEGNTSEFSECAEVSEVWDYMVNSTADPGDGICDSAECTLREAILAANGHPGPDIIAFNIPGDGPHTIHPLADLPAITDGVTIDGYTQPGASANTQPIEQGSNAILMVELSGDQLALGPGLAIDTSQLEHPVRIRGLAINRFARGIVTGAPYPTGEGHVAIQGNYIGLDATGETAWPNLIGIRAGDEHYPNPAIEIGGAAPEDCNVISGNHVGIHLEGSTWPEPYRVLGNLIGSSASGLPGVGNRRGIYLETVNCAYVGHNLLAYNVNSHCHDSMPEAAIEVWGSLRVTLDANSIHDNECMIGIDRMWGDAVTPNDPLDTFPPQNYPELGPIYRNDMAGEIVVHGTLYSAPDSTFTVQFFGNAECDPSGYGEGEVYLGSLVVDTDALGEATFEATFDDPGLPVVTATATNSEGNTSEFSECAEVLAAPPESVPAYAYVTDYVDDYVSVIDVTSQSVVATVPVGDSPQTLAILPTGAKVYVPNLLDETVSVIDTASRSVVATIPVGVQPRGVVASPSGDRVYVAIGGSNTISIIDTTADAVIDTLPVDQNPQYLAVSPDGRYLYLTHAETSGKLTVINTTDHTDVTAYWLPMAPDHITLTQDGSRAFVSHAGLINSISVIDTADIEILDTIAVGDMPRDSALTVDGVAYVANYHGDTVSVINTNNQVTSTISVAGSPYGVAVTPDQSQVWIASTTGVVSVIDTSTGAVTAELPIGGHPMAIAIAREASPYPLGMADDYDFQETWLTQQSELVATLAEMSDAEASTELAALPPALDWTGRYVSGSTSIVTAAKDQAALPTCVAFASTGAVESLHLLELSAGGGSLDLSEWRQVLWIGIGHAGNAAKFLRERATVTEATCPYRGWAPGCAQFLGDYPITNFCYTPRLISSLKNALQDGPLPVGMAVFADFGGWRLSHGPYNWNGTSPYQGLHLVLLAGYQDLPSGGGYFIVKNSWGQGWGDEGFCLISYAAVGWPVGFGRAAYDYYYPDGPSDHVAPVIEQVSPEPGTWTNDPWQSVRFKVQDGGSVCCSGFGRNPVEYCRVDGLDAKRCDWRGGLPVTGRVTVGHEWIEGVNSIALAVVDLYGNETKGQGAFLLDLTAPTFSIDNAGGIVIKVNDALSGVSDIKICTEEGGTVTIPEFTPGDANVSCPCSVGSTGDTHIVLQATDMAGNSRTCSMDYGIQNGVLSVTTGAPSWSESAMTCTFVATITNDSDQPLLAPVSMQVASFGGPGCGADCTINGEPATVKLKLDVPVAGNELAPGESVDFEVTVGMSEWNWFSLYVDILGATFDDDAGETCATTQSLGGGAVGNAFIIDPGMPGGGVYSVFLPLALP